MSEHLTTKIDTLKSFTPEAFPVRTDFESDDFQALDGETATDLALRLSATPSGELVSDNFQDENAPLGSKWRLIKYEPSKDGNVVLNLETWDLNGVRYYGMNKGPFRRSTIHQRQDGNFGYMGEMDHDIYPMSQQAGEALLGMLP